MRAALTVIAIGSALLLAANSAQALGFGRISNGTQLGQTLNFAAVVHLDADETLGRECVSAEVFSGDNKLQPGQIRVTLEGNPDSPDRMVRVTSNALIDEPIITVSVTLGCGAKVTRKFVAFIDPPRGNMAQQSASADVAALGPQRVDSQVSPLLSIVQAAQPVGPTPKRAVAAAPKTAARSGSPPTARRDEPTPPARRVATRKESAPRKPVSGSAAVVATRLLPSGPRLQLEATAPVMARAASAATTNVAATVPVLAASSADSLALAIAQQRIVTLEEGLALIRADSQATQKALAGLQAQLREAESQRYANPLVYVLAWLCGLLLLALATLWWRQSRNRQTAQWWAASGPALAADTDVARVHARELAEPAAAADESIPQALTGPMTVANAFAVAAATDISATGAAPHDGARAAALQRPGPAPAAAAEPVHELSVEELIDLEQQAEFFVVLGQDDAAIDLLVSHVRSDGGISPLPYLKLLEIYRRRGDRDAYERIRERFNRRFNAYAPEWDSDLQHGRSLEDYPDIIARLNALWPAPAQAMETLDASLFRRNKSDETFDLPAYRELLFLYSIARDLAEHGAHELHGEVDFLLPLAEDEASRPPVTRLVATPSQHDDFEHSEMMTMPVDLDISFGASTDPYDDGVETTPSALRRVPDHRFGTESGFLDIDVSDPRVSGKAHKPDGPAVP